MSVSLITQRQVEGAVADVSGFAANGVLYALWVTPPGSGGGRALRWSAHNGTTEVEAQRAALFTNPSAVIRSDGALLVVWATGDTADVELWAAAFNVTTGAEVLAPVLVAKGNHPSVMRLPGAQAGRITLSYDRKGSVYLRESYNDGASWDTELPVITNRVADTVTSSAVPFDDSHVSIAQVGVDARKLVETGHYARTRPLAGVLQSAVPGQVYALESVQRSVATVNQLADQLRAPLVLEASGDVLAPTRVRAGVADGLGDLVLFDTTNVDPTVLGSLALGGGATAGADLARALAGAPPAAGTTFADVFGGGSAAVVDIALLGTRAYLAGYTDANPAGGACVVLQLSDGSKASFLSGVSVRAVATDSHYVGGLVAVATTEAGVERIRLYTDNALAPTLVANHKLPARAQRMVLKLETATSGLLYVAADDRILIFKITAPDKPLRLIAQTSVISRGCFLQLLVTSSGNLVVAAGDAGVVVFAPTGETLAQLVPSARGLQYWKPGATVAPGDEIIPTEKSYYAPQRRFFRCTVGGTTGAVEPPWGTGVITDGSASWTQVDSRESYVTGVAVDEERRRIFAVGFSGGPTSTEGRFWTFDAPALVAYPDGYTPPADPGVPAVTATASTGRVDLAWADVPTATDGYRVWRSLVAGGPYTLLARLAAGATSYADTSARNGTRQYYVVDAIGPRISRRSAEADATTPPVPLSMVVDDSVQALWQFDTVTQVRAAMRPQDQYGEDLTESYIERDDTWASAGTVEVDYFIQAEAGDRLHVFVDGNTVASVGGSAAGVSGTLIGTVSTPGVRNIRVVWVKNGDTTVPDDLAYVTAVRFKAAAVIFASFDMTDDDLGLAPTGWQRGGDYGGFTVEVVKNTFPEDTGFYPASCGPNGSPLITSPLGKAVNPKSRLITAPADAALRALALADMTVELWLYPQFSGTFGLFGIGGAGNNLFSIQLVDLEPRVVTHQGTVRANVPLAAGSWQHLAVRKIGTLYQLFFNGVLAGQGTLANPTGAAAQIVQLGAADGVDRLDGLIDGVRVSLRARTEDEIKASYNRGLGIW